MASKIDFDNLLFWSGGNLFRAYGAHGSCDFDSRACALRWLLSQMRCFGRCGASLGPPLTPPRRAILKSRGGLRNVKAPPLSFDVWAENEGGVGEGDPEIRPLIQPRMKADLCDSRRPRGSQNRWRPQTLAHIQSKHDFVLHAGESSSALWPDMDCLPEFWKQSGSN